MRVLTLSDDFLRRPKRIACLVWNKVQDQQLDTNLSQVFLAGSYANRIMQEPLMLTAKRITKYEILSHTRRQL